MTKRHQFRVLSAMPGGQDADVACRNCDRVWNVEIGECGPEYPRNHVCDSDIASDEAAESPARVQTPRGLDLNAVSEESISA